MNPVPSPTLYVTSLEEWFWGTVLIAVTMAIHGYGMILTLHLTDKLRGRVERTQSLGLGATLLVFCSWLIITVHLVEIAVWSWFFVWQGALPNFSVAFYFSLLEYTTVGSAYNLPIRWRLLEGLIAVVGLLTFAWSTGVLLTMAREFQDRQSRLLQTRIKKRRALIKTIFRIGGEPRGTTGVPD
jgi:hypothetical protein